MVITLEELWRGVGRAAAEGVQLAPDDELVGEAEVGDLDVHLAVKEQVLGLQVAVNDLLLVAVLNRRQDLQNRDLFKHSVHLIPRILRSFINVPLGRKCRCFLVVSG
jgi:hypothetical protein